jgi:acetolactate synthase small subunit
MVASAPVTYRFAAETATDPGSVARVLEFFALNNFIPETISVQRSNDDFQHIEIVCGGLEYPRARLIAAKIGQLVSVRTSRLFESTRLAVVGSSGNFNDEREVHI